MPHHTSWLHSNSTVPKATLVIVLSAPDWSPQHAWDPVPQSLLPVVLTAACFKLQAAPPPTPPTLYFSLSLLFFPHLPLSFLPSFSPLFVMISPCCLLSGWVSSSICLIPLCLAFRLPKSDDLFGPVTAKYDNGICWSSGVRLQHGLPSTSGYLPFTRHWSLGQAVVTLG